MSFAKTRKTEDVRDRRKCLIKAFQPKLHLAACGAMDLKESKDLSIKSFTVETMCSVFLNHLSDPGQRRAAVSPALYGSHIAPLFK